MSVKDGQEGERGGGEDAKNDSEDRVDVFTGAGESRRTARMAETKVEEEGQDEEEGGSGRARYKKSNGETMTATASSSADSAASRATWRYLQVGTEPETLPAPSPRAGHTFVFNPVGNECILFGGASHEDGLYDSVQILDLGTVYPFPTKSVQVVFRSENLPSGFSTASLVWREPKVIEQAGNSPGATAPARYEHSALVVKSGDEPAQMLVLYGAGMGLTNDVWALDLGHVVVHNKSKGTKRNRIYMFGGGEAGDRPVDDTAVYCLDYESLMWIQVTAPGKGPAPKPRLGHSFTAIGDKIFLFGGSNPEREHDELWQFDTTTNSWTNPMTTGDAPSARSGHTATAVGKYLVLYGGLTRSPRPEVFDEIYLLDTDSFVWTKLDAAAEPPGPLGPRLDHDACLVTTVGKGSEGGEDAGHRSLLFFGGMDLQGMYQSLYELKLEL
ncbi:hypothetical protein HK104_008290 [Borealophlyctis nickersoniae]|nr:hypothetical protein HK104_008290 [Borealophlyctis nickersoniae]